MNIKRYTPITNGLRQRVVVRDKELWKGSGWKTLTKGKKSISGRNNTGKITIYHRGGAHKKKYRVIDFSTTHSLYNYFTVIRIEYDPNRSAYIALCKTKGNKYFYMLASEGLKKDQKIYGRFSNFNTNFQVGSTLPLNQIPLGTNVYNVGGKIARAAGVYCELLKISNKCVLRLPSKKLITVDNDTLATIGRVSNLFHINTVRGKAGVSRWLGRKPIVRGVAKNPIDHPHGGKTPVSGGRGGAHKTKWGKLAKWNK